MLSVSLYVVAIDVFYFRRLPTQLQQNLARHEARRQKEQPRKVKPDRDMASKFYGDHVDPNEIFKFQMPEGGQQLQL